MVNLEGYLSIAQGEPGEAIELRNNGSYIQWKYENEDDSSWRNLILNETLKGDEIQLRVNSTHIQWKYDDESIWKNLISLETLTPSIAHLENAINDKISEIENRMNSIEGDYNTLKTNFNTFEQTARTNETQRQNNETSRITAETNRETVFNQKISETNTVISNAENKISDCENRMTTIVGDYNTLKTDFNNFEATAQANEVIRQNNETSRITAETNRETVFNQKISETNTVISNAENKISDCENRMTDIEDDYNTLKSDFNEFEATAQANETQRQNNETDRINAETQRNNTFDTKIIEANTVILSAENKIVDCENRMTAIEENFDSLVDGTGFADKEYVDNSINNLLGNKIVKNSYFVRALDLTQNGNVFGINLVHNLNTADLLEITVKDTNGNDIAFGKNEVDENTLTIAIENLKDVLVIIQSAVNFENFFEQNINTTDLTQEGIFYTLTITHNLKSTDFLEIKLKNIDENRDLDVIRTEVTLNTFKLHLTENCNANLKIYYWR